MSEGPPPWDEQWAVRLIGKRVLIGITVIDGESISQEQMFGMILEADRERGVRVALEGSRVGEDYWLPSQPANFVAANPGEYKLRTTGEIVVDPDILSTWTINRPSS